MMESFTTSRPAPLRKGKPWLTSPRAGTQHSGVVMRKESVTNDIKNTRNPPKAASCGSHGWRQSNNPKRTIAARADRAAVVVTRLGLIVVLLWIGGLKAFKYEAVSIAPMVANSPLASFFYADRYHYKAQMNSE